MPFAADIDPTCLMEEAFEYCDSLTDVYYNGTLEQWNAITIEDCNEPLLNATIHAADPTIANV